jgi:hypothetical protein
VETRVAQTADVMRNLPESSYDDTLSMLLNLTSTDPDSQDIYIAYGDSMVFLDGSGWIPDGTFDFTDRAWYKGALEKKGDIYTSEPYVDASTGKTCLACAVMLRDGVVLSSDVNFDKVAEKLNSFESVSPDAKFYIINKETKDILVSTDQSIVGQNLSNTTDGIMQGLAPVFDKLNTSSDYFNSICHTTTSDGGTDMPLSDRKIEYIKDNKAVCQDDCQFSEYNYTIKNAKCSCNIKEVSNSVTDMNIDKAKLYENFVDINNIENNDIISTIEKQKNPSNLGITSCNVLASKENIKSNTGFFLLLFIIAIFIIIFIIFCTKGYNNLQNKIDDIIYKKFETKKKKNFCKKSTKKKNFKIKKSKKKTK